MVRSRSVTALCWSHPSAADQAPRSGCSRRGGWPWPTTLHPDRDRGPADLPYGAPDSLAGRAGRGPARRRVPGFLGVEPRTRAGSGRRLGLARADGDGTLPATTRAGRPGPGRGAPGRALGAIFVPASATRGRQCHRPAHALGSSGSPRRRGWRGPHLRLFEAVGRVHPRVACLTLPSYRACHLGAVLADLGLPARPAALVRSGGWPGRAGSSVHLAKSTAPDRMDVSLLRPATRLSSPRTPSDA